MRPSDENQHGSTRPNLLSGTRRHDGGDDNILERLERDSARHASGNRSRAALYAIAASLMLLLIIVLAWTAYDNASAVRVVPMTRVPESGAATRAAVAPDAASSPGPALIQVPVPAPPTPPPAPVDPQGSAGAALPPLVLLPSNKATASKAPAPTSRPARKAEPASPAVPTPARPVVRASSAAARAATAARAAPRPVVAVRQHKPGAGPLQADAGVDTDVALLSAIIIHDSAHAEEKAQMEAAAACARTGAKKCPGRFGGATVLAN